MSNLKEGDIIQTTIDGAGYLFTDKILLYIDKNNSAICVDKEHNQRYIDGEEIYRIEKYKKNDWRPKSQKK